MKITTLLWILTPFMLAVLPTEVRADDGSAGTVVRRALAAAARYDGWHCGAERTDRR